MTQGGWLRRLLRGRSERTVHIWWGPEPQGNDAAAYGVSIAEADVPPGEPYWRAVRVHHLTPTENNGNHHIYFDVLDESGQRVHGARLHITWDGGEDYVTIERPAHEPGANFPMWRGQVCAAEVEGLPSDRVLGLKSGHPDEAPGNTWFHHSFLVVYARQIKPFPGPHASTISGIVLNGAGRTALLLQHPQGGEVARAPVAEDGSFRFGQVAGGTYVVEVEGTNISSEPITVDGRNEASVMLTIPQAASTILGSALNGAGRIALLWQHPQGTEVARAYVAEDETFRFDGLSAGTYVVGVEGSELRSEPLTVDGQNEARAALVLPQAGSLIWGIAVNGAGRHVLLLRHPEGTEVARALVAEDTVFRFQPVEAGTYVVAIEGTRARSEPVTADGQNEVSVVVTLDLQPQAERGQSVISGRVRYGAGRTAVLFLHPQGAEVARAVIAKDASFRFTELGAGTYAIGVEGTNVRSEAIMVDGQNEVSVMLSAPQAAGIVRGTVKGGAGRTVALFCQGELVDRDQVRPDERFSFVELSAGTYVVEVEGTGVRSAPVTVSREEEEVVELALEVSAEAGRAWPLAHYVLFGPPTAPGTQTDMLLAVDYLLTFRPSFGFRRAEAELAARVTIIGDTVSQADEEALRGGGRMVERIGGGAVAVERALAARVARGTP